MQHPKGHPRRDKSRDQACQLNRCSCQKNHSPHHQLLAEQQCRFRRVSICRSEKYANDFCVDADQSCDCVSAGDEMCTDYHYKRTNNIPIDPQPGVIYAGTHLPRSESPYEFHVISPTMIIVKSSNLETNEVRYGIIYRNVVKTDSQKQIDDHYIRSTWDAKYREEYTQFVIDESNRSLFSRLATKM